MILFVIPVLKELPLPAFVWVAFSHFNPPSSPLKLRGEKRGVKSRRDERGLGELTHRKSASTQRLMNNPKGISVIFLIIALLLMVIIGYVFSYLIPTKQKSVVYPIQSTQAFFLARSGVEFAIQFARANNWTTPALLTNLNTAPNNTRSLGAGRFVLNYNSGNDALDSWGEVPVNTERRRVRVSNFTSFVSITYVGSTSVPVDNGSNYADPTSILTTNMPSGMQAGDLVLMIAQARVTGTLSINSTGGQTWTSELQQNGNNARIRLFWCRFNGTWSADPSVNFASTNSNTLVMHVFRPPTVPTITSGWQRDVAQASGNITPGAAPNYTVTIPSITTVTNGALVFAVWATPDDNQWGALTGGWTTPGSAQYRNLGYNNNNHESQTHAYRIMATAGATGAVTKNETANGPDNGRRLSIAFRAVITCTYP